MPVKVLSVREARAQLPSILESFRGGDRRPVFLGSHRRTEAVMIPVEVYEELIARRRDIAADTAEIRTVAIAKTDMFCLPQFIEPYANDVFLHLAMEKHLRGLPRDAFVDRLAHYLAEINAIHPFREGNGRTQRAFFNQLARDANWTIRWRSMDPEENIDASIAALRGDNGPLRAMLDRLVAPDPPDE
jgi:PHD/YefM family antitoxin component YafN of YafNO toxin-antitoxin module